MRRGKYRTVWRRTRHVRRKSRYANNILATEYRRKPKRYKPEFPDREVKAIVGDEVIKEQQLPEIRYRVPDCSIERERVRRAYFGYKRTRPHARKKGGGHQDRFTMKKCTR